MQVIIDTTELTDEEAGGIIELLAKIRPNAPYRLGDFSEPVRVEYKITPGGGLSLKEADPELHARMFAEEERQMGRGPAQHADHAEHLDPATAFGGTPTTVAPTPQPPAAPAASPPAPSVGSAIPQLDADGLPWDARIHSSNHKLTGKGTWWGKKGVSADLIAQVTQELKAAAQFVQVGTTTDVPPPPPVEAPPVPQPPAVAAAPTPPPPPVVASQDTPASGPETTGGGPTAPAPAAPAAEAPRMDFTTIMRRFTDAQRDHGVTTAQVNQILQLADTRLTQPRDLVSNPDLVPAAWAALDAWLS